MQKIKVRKDVAEEVVKKLGNKNIFTRGDFDEYKITDEELKEHEDIEKSRLPKYIQKIPDGKGGFTYIYEKNEKQAVKKVDFCTSSLLNCNMSNAKTVGEKYIFNWGKRWKKGHKCESLNGMKVVLDTAYKPKLKRYGISVYHLSHKGMKTGGKLRSPKDIYERARLLPIAEEILTDKKKGIVTEVRQEGNKVEYSVCGKVKINNKIQIVCVVVSRIKPADSVYISTINKAMPNESDIAIISDVYLVDPITLTNQQRLDLGLSGLSNHFDKAVETSSTKGTSGKLRNSISDSLPKHSLNIPQRNNLSSKKVIKSLTPDYNGESRLHKSFDIQITDITENNKQQKLEQFNKALNAIAKNQPFMIKHIPADNSTKYENLTVRLLDFDRSKIEKAVHKVALSLDADISGASKGEAFVYKSQEEIVDKFFKEFTNSTRAIYNFVIGYFDLPDIRIVSKAGELKHKGKILYNPETGLPIKEADWKKFVVELEKYLNRHYSGIGKKIVLSAESLGIILDRLSKTNSLEAIRKMSLSGIKSKRYDVDWISESIQNMKDKFGEVISRERQARIQIACDSAAQRVTRVTDDMRNNIQQIIIDGIRDKQSKSVVAQNLFDKCSSLNRDMQRIADSEVQMAVNSAYCKEEVYNSKPDEKVYFRRFEMMDDNTCKKCKALKGEIVLWSDVPLPDDHIKDPYAKYAIWEGKNEGDRPIGIVHPYCRGSWVRYYPDIDVGGNKE